MPSNTKEERIDLRKSTQEEAVSKNKKVPTWVWWVIGSGGAFIILLIIFAIIWSLTRK